MLFEMFAIQVSQSAGNGAVLSRHIRESISSLGRDDFLLKETFSLRSLARSRDDSEIYFADVKERDVAHTDRRGSHRILYYIPTMTVLFLELRGMSDVDRQGYIVAF